MVRAYLNITNAVRYLNVTLYFDDLSHVTELMALLLEQRIFNHEFGYHRLTIVAEDGTSSIFYSNDLQAKDLLAIGHSKNVRRRMYCSGSGEFINYDELRRKPVETEASKVKRANAPRGRGFHLVPLDLPNNKKRIIGIRQLSTTIAKQD